MFFSEEGQSNAQVNVKKRIIEKKDMRDKKYGEDYSFRCVLVKSHITNNLKVPKKKFLGVFIALSLAPKANEVISLSKGIFTIKYPHSSRILYEG